MGCSGNFTVERCVAELGPLLHGNDVSIYTCALGAYFAEQPFRIAVREEFKERWGWLEEFLEDPAEIVATIMIATRMLDHADSDQRYYLRLQEGYREQWAGMLKKTVDRVRTNRLRLQSFYAGDVVEFLRDMPESASFVSFPPFFVAGYEAMWRWLDKVFEWDTPEYQVFDDARREEMFELVKSKANWLMATNVKQHELTEHQVGWVQVTDRNVPFWVYSSMGSSRVAVPRQKLEPVLMPRLGQGQEIGDEIALHALTPGQFGSLRSQYLDPRIAPGQAMLAVGVSVDGQLVGCFAASEQNFPGARWAHSGAYLMSDFAVAPTEYPRLSKLVVMAACSKEAQLLMQRTLNRRIRGLITTAFSDNAVSMKYDRGTPFTLVGRKDSPSPRFRYQLQYEAPIGELSLAETLVEWKKRHGKRRPAAAPATPAATPGEDQ